MHDAFKLHTQMPFPFSMMHALNHQIKHAYHRAIPRPGPLRGLLGRCLRTAVFETPAQSPGRLLSLHAEYTHNNITNRSTTRALGQGSRRTRTWPEKVDVQHGGAPETRAASVIYTLKGNSEVYYSNT